MTIDPDPLLLELFDCVEKELAQALEILQRWTEAGRSGPEVGALTSKITRLRESVDALEGALERRNSRIVH